MPLLHNGDAFPKLDVPAVGGGTIALPAALAGSWGVILIYRGAWCPFCNAQLAGFAAEKEALDGLGMKVVALSVDDEATSAATKAKNHVQFPVGHSADADAVAAATGVFVNQSPHFLQPAGFVLAPDGTVKAAAYATSAIGRVIGQGCRRLCRLPAIGSCEGGGGRVTAMLDRCGCHARRSALPRARWLAKPSPTKPSSIIAQVEASGAGVARKP